MTRRLDQPGVVCAAFPDASEAGAFILRAGGNAVDAACAAAWALAVCEPGESGLGGQTTALIRTAGGEMCVVDGCSWAPAGVTRTTVSRRAQRRGVRSMTVPTTPATLAEAQARFGRLPLRTVLSPAIRIAEEGYAITRQQRRLLRWTAGHWSAGSAEARQFLPGGEIPAVGAVFRQPALARTLRRMAEHGVRDFYEGEIAEEIDRHMRSAGGLIAAADLRGVHPVLRAPVECRYRGYRVASAPPPAGGVQVLVALRVLEHLTDAAGDEDEWREAIATATLAAFRERERWPDHPRDVDPSILSWIVSGERAAAIARRIREGDAPEPVRDSMGEGGNTTHLCAADGEGGVVSLTQTIQSVFGSKVVHPTLGFVYNNSLSTNPRRVHAYRLGPGCHPQSNAAPTLVMDAAGAPCLTLGSAGSRRITSSIVQVLSAVIDRGAELAEAIGAPRAHALLSGRLWYESSMPAASLDRLRRAFRSVKQLGQRSYKLGAVQAIVWAGGSPRGAADPRRDGAVAVP